MTGASAIVSFVRSSMHRFAPPILCTIGVAAVAHGIITAPERIWPGLLLNGFYVLSLAVGGLLFIAVQRLSGARWSASLRRIPEAFLSVMPVAAAMMLALFFGLSRLYPWARPESASHLSTTAGHAQYLTVPFVLLRTIAALLSWTVFAWLARRISLAQDRDPSLIHHRRLNRLSAVFVLVFAITFTFMSFDWLASLDPEWFSTIFAVYLFAGCFVQSIAAITIATVALRRSDSLRGFVNEDQLHDFGKLLFAFSTFWAYIWVCQYLLIWYTNLPDEISHYLTRTSGPWRFLFLLNFALNWIIPFAVLLPRKAKRAPKVLLTIGILLLCGHWLDLYLIITPSISTRPHIGVLELATAAGYAGITWIVVKRALQKSPLLPVNDPFLIDSLRLDHGT